MKITFFIGCLYGGGAERVICELASYFNKQGYDVELLVASRTENKYPVDSDVSFEILESTHRIRIKIFRVAMKMLNLYKYIKKSHTDIYIAFLPTQINALLFFRKIIHVPIITSERNDPNSYSNITLKALCKSYKMSNGIVFQTEQSKKYIENLVSQMPLCTVIPNAVNYISDNSIDINKNKNVIISVGRFNRQKNFPLLIKAFSLIANEYPKIVLKIYGEGDLRNEYEALIQSLNLKGRVLLPGFADNVYTELYNAGMFVLSSDYEGIPNALIEAMSVGLPCISTDCSGGGAKLLIKNGQNGLLVPVGEQKQMAEAMKKILDDRSFAANISSQAKKICDEYSPQIIYAKWDKFVHQVIETYYP